MPKTIQKTTTEERELLQRAGFVRVDGLKTFESSTRQVRLGDDPVIGDGLPVTQLGRWDQNNGKRVIVTPGGEIWLAAMTTNAAVLLHQGAATYKIASRGPGAFVPCSNGEHVQLHDLLQRLADPDWKPSY